MWRGAVPQVTTEAWYVTRPNGEQEVPRGRNEYAPLPVRARAQVEACFAFTPLEMVRLQCHPLRNNAHFIVTISLSACDNTTAGRILIKFGIEELN
jgi:hypothetical protein